MISSFPFWGDRDQRRQLAKLYSASERLSVLPQPQFGQERYRPPLHGRHYLFPLAHTYCAVCSESTLARGVARPLPALAQGQRAAARGRLRIKRLHLDPCSDSLRRRPLSSPLAPPQRPDQRRHQRCSHPPLPGGSCHTLCSFVPPDSAQPHRHRRATSQTYTYIDQLVSKPFLIIGS